MITKKTSYDNNPAVLSTRNCISIGVKTFVFVLLLANIVIPVNRNNSNNIASRGVLALSFGGYCSRCNTHHVLPTTEEAKKAALDLRDRMIRSGRIDIDELPAEIRTKLLRGGDGGDNNNFEGQNGDSHRQVGLDPSLATERLYERRGKMFGVLVCQAPGNSSSINPTMTTTRGSKSKQNTHGQYSTPSMVHHKGNVVILKAYAGKLGDQWNQPGWAPLVGKVPESIPEFRRISTEVSGLFERIDSLSQQQQHQQQLMGTNVDDTEFSTVATQIRELTKKRSHLSNMGVQEL